MSHTFMSCTEHFFTSNGPALVGSHTHGKSNLSLTIAYHIVKRALNKQPATCQNCAKMKSQISDMVLAKLFTLKNLYLGFCIGTKVCIFHIILRFPKILNFAKKNVIRKSLVFNKLHKITAKLLFEPFCSSSLRGCVTPFARSKVPKQNRGCVRHSARIKVATQNHNNINKLSRNS